MNSYSIYRFGKYSTSLTEIRHLLQAIFFIGITFIYLQRDTFAQFSFYDASIIISLFVIGIVLAFLLHELAHKISAQYYGYRSEFRSDIMLLVAGVAFAYLFDFTLLFPGAVLILGRLTIKESGIIALAGPATNIVLALLFYIIAFLSFLVFGSSPYFQGLIFAGMINSWLGLFNMLPIFIFDGKKILTWNPSYYVITACILVLLTFYPVRIMQFILLLLP